MKKNDWNHFKILKTAAQRRLVWADQVIRQKKTNLAAITISAIAISGTAMADLAFDGKNRFILSGKRMPVVVENTSDKPALAQIFIERPGFSDSELPVAVSQPLLFLHPNSRRTTEILYQGIDLPTDRETYFLLNILEIPENPESRNALQVTLNHKFKLLYRPKLKEPLSESIKKLSWKIGESNPKKITISNTSPYYITLSDIRSTPGSSTCPFELEHLMIEPFSDGTIDTPCEITNFNYNIVSDEGNFLPYEIRLSSHEAKEAHKSQGNQP